jgi:CheY-like chemotaxis protein
MRCLIVDDNESFLEVAQTLLEQEGLSVVGVAPSGTEALRQITSLHPDVVLIDIFLGEESGLELARRLAGDGQGDGATLILISTRPDLGGLTAASPAAGFVPKEELSAGAIRRIVDGCAR